MQYVLMIHADEAAMSSMTPEEVGPVAAAVDQFDREISDAGQNIGSIRLQPSGTATTVRVRDGKTLTTDGPFAETKEQLGGIYLIHADDLDGALSIAARLADCHIGTVEVRPVMGLDIRQLVSP